MSYITIDNLTNIMAEMTDYCNAACPMCNRYDWDLNLVNGITNKHHTTLEFVKLKIGDKIISKLERWFCQGTYGDALMNPETVEIFTPPLYSIKIGSDGTEITDVDQNGGQVGYNYYYDFSEAYEEGTIFASIEPSVFELKNPNENVKGVVR